MPNLHTFSYGGGVQSNAALVLAGRGILPHRTFLFSNVGEDSEHPDTLAYVEEVAKPFAAEHGIDLIELRFARVKTGPQTLWERMFKEGGAAVTIPAFLPSGMPTERACTQDHKAGVIAKWLTENGATEEEPALVALGFSTDEVERCKPARDANQIIEWPLIKGYGLSMNRADCMATIRAAGLPVPPKSSCFFCPWHSLPAWQELKRTRPDLFTKAQQLEDRLIEGRLAHGNPVPVYLTRHGRRLSDVIKDDQGVLFGDDEWAPALCDTGGCWT